VLSGTGSDGKAGGGITFAESEIKAYDFSKSVSSFEERLRRRRNWSDLTSIR
jgi:hypothetical protein